MKRIVQGLNIGNLSKSSRRTKDKDQFIELLQSQSNSVKMLSVVKNRQQHPTSSRWKPQIQRQQGPREVSHN